MAVEAIEIIKKPPTSFAHPEPERRLRQAALNIVPGTGLFDPTEITLHPYSCLDRVVGFWLTIPSNVTYQPEDQNPMQILIPQSGLPVLDIEPSSTCFNMRIEGRMVGGGKFLSRCQTPNEAGSDQLVLTSAMTTLDGYEALQRFPVANGFLRISNDHYYLFGIPELLWAQIYTDVDTANQIKRLLVYMVNERNRSLTSQA